MTDSNFSNRFLTARRALIAGDFSYLNDMQKAAVMTTNGPLLLLAGAGSGKTTVLINRIANLLKYGSGSDSEYIPEHITEEDLVFLEKYVKSPNPENYERALSLASLDPVDPWRIIAITFTNKAANELKSRLENMLGPEANDVWAMTFHSACVRILRRDIPRLGFSSSFTIYDTADSQSIMKRILKDLEMDEKVFPARTVLSYISRAKDAMISPEEFCESAEKSQDIRKKNIGKAYAEYSRRLRDANALDFDDLILFTVKLLLEHEDIRKYYQQKFKYVLIDEYQDTNYLQYLLASSLAGGHQNICVVGDDDQSIYKFRGATIENILNFEKQYKNARVIRLEQNYRSTGHILSASNAVVKNNQARKGKELWTDKEDGEKLKLFIADNEHDEAQYVASQIIASFSAGQNWRDFAVLYRMNAQSNQLEYAFKRNGIPYHVVGGMPFFDRAEIKDMISYLCVINNPADDLRLFRIVNNPPRGIGQKTLETAREIAFAESKTLYDVFKDSNGYPELQKSAARLNLFVNIIETLREQAEYLPLDELYDSLLVSSGYIRMLEEKKSEENTTKLENVNELKSNISAYMSSSSEASLASFLDEIALYTDLDQQNDSDDKVVLMTMHSAKGLEFPTVFIVGAEDGIFPGIRVIGEIEEMEEERRLCYVAMTRAKQRLIFTCARQRMLFGSTSSNRISRFIDEIPDENIEKPTSKKSYNFESYGHRRPRQKLSPAVSSLKKVSTPTAASTDFKTGDSINHHAFGHGVIKTLKPIGGDALVEIEFEGVGLKRLMLKSASNHMEKM